MDLDINIYDGTLVYEEDPMITDGSYSIEIVDILGHEDALSDYGVFPLALDERVKALLSELLGREPSDEEVDNAISDFNKTGLIGGFDIGEDFLSITDYENGNMTKISSGNTAFQTGNKDYPSVKINKDGNIFICDDVGNDIIRLGKDTGEDGLFIYDTSGTKLAKYVSDQIFVGNDDERLKYSVAGGLEISEPIISDVFEAGEDIDAGKYVCILDTGKVVRTNYQVDPNRNYGITTEAVLSGNDVKVQKSGPWYTTGLDVGSFYVPGNGSYGSEVIVKDQLTRDSVYDAHLGVGQTVKGSMLFNSAISWFLTPPGGAGTYGYVLNIYELLNTDGGRTGSALSTNTVTLTRSGSTVTASPTSFNVFYYAGMYVTISGADQAEYNGTFRLTSGTGNSSYTYEISGTPATPATGTITAVYRSYKWSLSGNTTLAGGENFIKFNLESGGLWPGLNNIYPSMYTGADTSAKYLIEFYANNAGEINIGYNSSSVYDDGDLWLTGVKDATKDVAFRFRQANGGGVLTAGLNSSSRSVGIARSSTELMLGKFS